MNWLAIIEMALGLGLVVFVHELGHFIAARLCKVDVRVFSLGFGPPIASFERGGTRYQIALVPIGGFVAMAGEFAGERKGPPAPGDVLGKTVGQRFFIYSAGVLMNVVFAVVLLPILFWVGVPFVRPLLGEPVTGGPAWQAGLQPGTQVLEINGNKVFNFDQIFSEVVLAEQGPIEMLVRAPGVANAELVSLEPVEGSGGFRTIGVDVPEHPLRTVFVEPGGSAERAGLRSGESILGVVGQPSELPVRRQISRALVPGHNLEIVVADETGAERNVVIELSWGPGPGSALIGVAPCANLVAAVRGGGPLAELLVEGSQLEFVRGRPIGGYDDLLDALLEGVVGERSTARLADGSVVDATAALEAHVASRVSAVRAADDIALEPDLSSAIVDPLRGGAAQAAGIMLLDRVTSIGGRAITDWPSLLEAVRATARSNGPIEVVYERTLGGANSSIVNSSPVTSLSSVMVTARTPEWTDIGFELTRANYVYRTSNPSEALSAGLASAKKMFTDVWLGLKRMLTADISSKNLGGVISMGVVSYHTAKEGPAKLLFFLCLLSINLAVINVLPVPVLDGGHLLFLVVEKIKGGPISERVLGYSQLVGFVMIVSLIVYVTWNDLQRFVLN